MFKFFKDKLKKVVSDIGKRIEEEGKEEEKSVEEVKEEIKEKVEEKVKKEVSEKKGFFSFLKKKREEKKVEEKKEEIKEPKNKINEKKSDKKKIEKLEEKSEKKAEENISKKKIEENVKEKIKKEIENEEKKLGIFGKFKEKIITKKISEDKFNELFEELELTLLENNVSVEVIEKLKDDLKKDIVNRPMLRKEIKDLVESSLKESINGLFVDGFDILEKIKEKKPYVIVFVGINGGGKTTTLAKLAKLFLNNKKSCVLVAADTFRAASIQQLEEHGKKLGVKVIKHDYGSDAGAVAFDAIKYAEARKIDVVLIDTAGRLHNNKDLIREMQKIMRVSKPDLKLFVGESITGNDAVLQAQEFDKSIGVDGIILTKADVDDKGGTAVSISYVTKKPILYLCVGQSYTDLESFNKDKLLKSLGFN